MMENSTPNDASKKDVKLLIGQATEKQIADWKEKYPLGIFAVKKDGRIAYFKNPGFDEINYYHAIANKNENVSAQWKALAEKTFIGGCEELYTSPRYLPNVSKKLQDAMIGEEAELVNL